MTASRAILHRPCGIETEFGVTLEGEYKRKSDQSKSSYAFFDLLDPQWIIPRELFVPWDPRSRLTEDKDAEEHGYFASQRWLEKSNLLLPNGARLYLDGPHAELSTPICGNPLQLLRWNRASYAFVHSICKKHFEKRGLRFTIFRNNFAGRSRASVFDPDAGRVSFGSHENYTTLRTVPLNDLVSYLGCSWYIARTPIIGAGKVGCDVFPYPQMDFQISQRADFFSAIQSINTTHERPLFNTRDVTYGDSSRYRRVHCITGDSNMLQMPEYLKISLTSLVLMMIEDGEFPARLVFHNPVHAFHSVSWDIAFAKTYDMEGTAERRSVLYVLQAFRDVFDSYLARYHPERRDLRRAVKMFSNVLDCLARKDLPALYGKLDWITKYSILRRYCERKGKSPQSFEAAKFDLLYHDNDHENGFFFRGPHSPAAEEKKLVPEKSFAYAIKRPPPTRSRLIVEAIRRYSERVYISNYWDKISVRDQNGDIKLITFPDPTFCWRSDLRALFRRPFDEFLRRGQELGILHIEAECTPMKPITLGSPDRASDIFFRREFID